MLRNFEYAAARNPDLSMEAGRVSVIGRNFAGRSIDGPFVLVPQNAWPWCGPRLGLREHGKLALLRRLSERSMRRAVGVIRVGPSIPAIGNVHPRLLPNPLDLGFEEAWTAAPRASVEGEPYFISVGSMNSYRGLETLVGAFRRYRLDSGRVGLRIVGSGNRRYSERIRRLAKEVPALTFEERSLERADVLALMRDSRMAILPSHVEASPLSLLEALAVSPHVAASDIPGHRAIVPDGTDHPSYFEPTSELGLATLMHESEAARGGRTRPSVLASRPFRSKERERWSDALAEALGEFRVRHA